MGIGASINRVMPQVQQATQQPSAPSSIGGKGSALNQAVQPSQSSFGAQQVQQPQGPQNEAFRVYNNQGVDQFGFNRSGVNPAADAQRQLDSQRMSQMQQGPYAAQAQQAFQNMQQPQPMGGKGLAAPVQPSQSAFGTQQVQPMAGEQLQAQRDLLAAQSFQNMQQQPYMQPFGDRLASMQQQAQQLLQPAMQAGPFNPMLQSSQPVNQITGGFRDALQQRQQPTVNPAVQNILRRSRGLGGKGMR
jgi:hypothetical protein